MCAASSILCVDCIGKPDFAVAYHYLLLHNKKLTRSTFVGPGEPFATAAGVLGLMALWRSFYTVYLDFWNIRTIHGSPVDRYQDMLHFADALRSALLVSIAFCIVLQFLRSSLGEEGLQQLFSAFHFLTLLPDMQFSSSAWH